ncbi:MAG TPA: sulfotransferase domain-containing protein [Candidatus Nanopelagicaceae bacterium]|nr:sulfotransferase domain-containing protein [Candidatus Nanopelagicaceae bacterium]
MLNAWSFKEVVSMLSPKEVARTFRVSQRSVVNAASGLLGKRGNHVPPSNAVDYGRLVLIASNPRSGTHALGSVVSQDGIGTTYYGEMFGFNVWSKEIRKLERWYPFFGLRYFLHFRGQKLRGSLLDKRFELSSIDPLKVIRAMLATPGSHIAKLFPTHLSDEIVESIFSEFRPRVIYIRRNHLDRLISHKRAVKSGHWINIANGDVEIEITSAELRVNQRWAEEHYAKIVALTEKFECPLLDIDYSDLFADSNMIKVLEFVTNKDDLDFSTIDLQPKTPRQSKSNSENITYLDELANENYETLIRRYEFKGR